MNREYGITYVRNYTSKSKASRYTVRIGWRELPTRGIKCVAGRVTTTMGVVYADKESGIQSELRTRILESARGGSPQKPWNIVESVAENPDFSEEEARKALKEMMLDGELEIASTGEVRATTSPA